MRKALFLVIALSGLCIVPGAVGIRELQAEPELVIVKYGKVVVTSPVADAKVFVDDVYKGRVETVIENITVGDHIISCRSDSRAVTGSFPIKRDEVLKLEARFDEGKLRPVVEKVVVVPEKTEPEKKPKAEAPKPEKPKKRAVVEAKKIEEKKNPVEERRELHLSVLKVFFEDLDAREVRVTHKTNPKVIGKYLEKKNQTGRYYRTKQNVLLCETGPCEQQWSASFVYTDDTGKSDTFGLTWKQTVFNGITPAGTSKRELLFCLNSACTTLVDATAADTPQAAEAGRYHITWSKSSLVVRRSDIMKEVITAGGAVEAY